MFPVLFFLLAQPAIALEEGSGQQARVAQLVFHNECTGRLACLTSWNRGEAFASLGIGHFIWYPTGTEEADKPFRESFPQLLVFLRSHDVVLPDWLVAADGCPWPDRSRFMDAGNASRMQILRSLLQQSMPLQAAFMRQRLDRALPEMLKAAPERLRGHIKQQYRRVAASPMGGYVLTDYVNFKGEGVKRSERYHGQGWGLMQVLQVMQGKEPGLAAIEAFARSANAMLTRRVTNSPPERNEARWLSGWRKRLATYPAEARKEIKRAATD